MSYYEDERPRRSRSVRDRPRDDYDETVYNTRDNVRSTAVVRRRDSSLDSVEDIRRDFSPPGGYYRETTIRKSGTRPAGGRSRSFDDDRHYDDDSRYSGRRDSAYYSKRKSRDYDDRRDRRSSKYDDDSGSSRSRTPPKRERRKSMPEEALEALGLGGVIGALTGKKDRSRSRDRDSRRSRSRAGRDRSRSDSRGRHHGREQLTQALKAAVLAGAGEAFRARNEPGGWGGDKGKRVLTAAFAAGGVDGLINSHKDPETHKARDTIGSAIAGLATSRIVNGPRSKSRGRSMSPDSRRSRSRSRTGLGNVAAGGVLAATAKKAYDSIRSRSRGRDRSRSVSDDSYGSRSPPKRARSRSRSVIARGLAAVGLDKQADKVDPHRRESARRYSDDYSDGDGYDNVGHQPPPPSYAADPPSGIGRSRSVGPTASGFVTPPPGGYQLDYGPHHFGDPATDSDSDLGSSSEDEKEHKKGRKRLLITGGLASVATIHAGHQVYQSWEKRQARRKNLRNGKISQTEASRNKNRDRLQDAASIGLAALGLKGAYSEWKEMKEANEEHKEHQEKIRRHAEKRANRRKKMSMLGSPDYSDEYSSSMPNLTANEVPPPGHYYNGTGPYAARHPGNVEPGFAPPPMGPDAVHYTDENPYAWAGYAPQMSQMPPAEGHPPAPEGTGFPPPPVAPHSQ